MLGGGMPSQRRSSLLLLHAVPVGKEEAPGGSHAERGVSVSRAGAGTGCKGQCAACRLRAVLARRGNIAAALQGWHHMQVLPLLHRHQAP